MSEWKRNKRRTSGFPKGVWHGMTIEARQRDGQVFTGVVGEHEWLQQIHFDTSDGCEADIMAYRIVSEPAAAQATTPPDYSKGFPVGTTAKDIGAKVGDEFVVVGNHVSPSHHFKEGDVVKLHRDDYTHAPEFTDLNGKVQFVSFSQLMKRAIPPKTAIELQAEEVGIPEPVQLVDDAKPDADGWIEWNGGDCPVPKGALIDVKYRNGHEENAIPAGEYSGASHRMSAIDWSNDGRQYDIAAYRLHQPQEWPEDRVDVIGQNGNDGLHYTSERQKAEIARDSLIANGTLDPAKVVRREDVNIGPKSEREPPTAPDFLQSALNTLTQRGKDYDKPEGERSAAAVAVAFNAITGKDLTDAEVYLVLQLVKDVRQWQCADYHADSALDCVAYAALKAEALAGGGK